MSEITENQIETLSLEALKALAWEYLHGLSTAPEAEKSERESFEPLSNSPLLGERIAAHLHDFLLGERLKSTSVRGRN
jgi:hypothetical protein